MLLAITHAMSPHLSQPDASCCHPSQPHAPQPHGHIATPLPAAYISQIYMPCHHTSPSWMHPIIMHLAAAHAIFLPPSHLYSYIAAPLQPYGPHCYASWSCMAMSLPPLQLHMSLPPIAATHATLLHTSPLHGPCWHLPLSPTQAVLLHTLQLHALHCCPLQCWHLGLLVMSVAVEPLYLFLIAENIFIKSYRW
jgi:hypothetical protein